MQTGAYVKVILYTNTVDTRDEKLIYTIYRKPVLTNKIRKFWLKDMYFNVICPTEYQFIFLQR